MSLQTMTWAGAQRTGSPGAKAVLMAIANYADERHECYPSVATLAFDSEQSYETVRRKLAHLESIGLIERDARVRGDGSRSSNLIRLLVHAVPRIVARGAPPDEKSEVTGEEITPPQIEEGSPQFEGGSPQIDGGHPPTVGGRSPHCWGVQQNNQLTTSLTYPPNPPPGGRARADEKSDGAEGETSQAGPAVGGDAQLDELMAAFAADASVVLARPEAARVWSRLSAADRACALARLPRYLDHCAKHKNKIRAPASYLRGRVWEQFEVAARPAPQIERGEADAVCRAVAWAESFGSDRSGWPFVPEGTAEWDLWAAAYRHAGRAFAVGRRTFAPDGSGGFAHQLGRSFPTARPPALHDPPQAGEAAE